ncbi:MAG: hypothetical protein AABZ30_15335 [Myxococcota bacterium]|mgnify:CR=1 FL=1
MRKFSLTATLIFAGVASAQEITAASVGLGGRVLIGTTNAAGQSVLTSIDPTTFATTETSLGAGTVSDLETLAAGDAVAFVDGSVLVFDTGELLVTPFLVLNAVAERGSRRVFGNTTEVATCVPSTGACTTLDGSFVLTDLNFVGDKLAVLSDGKVLFYQGETLVATLRNWEPTVGIRGLRVTADAIGTNIGPCTIVDANATTGGMLIASAGVRFVPTENLAGATPIARARAAVLQGTIHTTDFAGDLLLDQTGRIVEIETGNVIADFTGVSIFPTAIKSFDLGLPLTAVALGGSAVFIDRDGVGPLAPEVLAGEIVHFIEPNLEATTLQRNANAAVKANIELPGSFVARIDPFSIRLAGAAPDKIEKIWDHDGDHELELRVKFKSADLTRTLPTGSSRVFLTGTVDGVPIQGSTFVTVR